MEYQISASSISDKDAIAHVKQSSIEFGTTLDTADVLPNPAELFLSSIAACILKNVERVSNLMKFRYVKANIVVQGFRLEKPPRMDNITYDLIIFSNDDSLNMALLQKNIEKYGTIYNTVGQVCSISGNISQKVINV